MAKLFQVCVLCEIISVLFASAVLALSLVRLKSRYHAIPRIFTINLMAFDIIGVVCSLFLDYALANTDFFGFLIDTGRKNFSVTQKKPNNDRFQ